MNNNSQRAVEAYAQLEQGPIDEIDAAVFTGDMFRFQSNRDAFYEMLNRWDRQLQVWEKIEKEGEEAE